jgi:hypothetical protein
VLCILTEERFDVHASLVLALLTGVGLAAASGLRAFLPLLAVGLASRAGWLDLRPGSEWLASDLALWALGTAAVLEIAGDKFPVVDHALDALGTVVRPAAAWVATFAVLSHWPAPWPALFASIFGAGALALQIAKAKARLTSTALTLGHGNPVLSFAEDAGATTLLVLAIAAPIVGALVAIAGVVVVVMLLRRKRPAAA